MHYCIEFVVIYLSNFIGRFLQISILRQGRFYFNCVYPNTDILYIFGILSMRSVICCSLLSVKMHVIKIKIAFVSQS